MTVKPEASAQSSLLTDQLKAEIRAEMTRCGHAHAACLDALHIVSDHYGWVSDDLLGELADFLGMTPEELDSAATFYNHVYRRPVGRNVILVCDSVTCWIMGYEEILSRLTSRLGINIGETTKDGRFTILPIQCLGVCEQAPAIMVNHDLHTNLSPARVDAILELYR
jgi:NADH-quinone oxidoreductase subunit E